MTCNKLLKEGQWWHFCGETDMGQTMPVQCTECGGKYELASPEKQAEAQGQKADMFDPLNLDTLSRCIDHHAAELFRLRAKVQQLEALLEQKQ